MSFEKVKPHEMPCNVFLLYFIVNASLFFLFIQELLHHVYDGHNISESNWDPNGDCLSRWEQWSRLGGFQRVLGHSVPD